MTTRACPACDAKVPADAKECPACGHVLAKTVSITAIVVFALVAAALVLTLFLFGLDSPTPLAPGP